MAKGFKLKLSALFLCALMSSNVVFSNATVFAAEKQIKADYQDVSTNQVTDVDMAIQVIESKYLERNVNGTSFITNLDEVEKLIAPDVLNDIKSGMKSINSEIEKGNLILNSSNELVSSELVSSSALSNNRLARASVVSGVQGTYKWYWHGFDFIMNAKNAGIFSSKLAQVSAALAAGGVITFVIPGLSFGLAATSATVAYMSAKASEGNANGKGAIAYFMGDPSYAQLLKVTPR